MFVFEGKYFAVVITACEPFCYFPSSEPSCRDLFRFILERN